MIMNQAPMMNSALNGVPQMPFGQPRGIQPLGRPMMPPQSNPMPFIEPLGSIRSSQSTLGRPGFAKGGAVKKKQSKYILAHISSAEGDMMDQLQGGRKEDPTTGLREYSSLDDHWKNPHVLGPVYSKMQAKKSGGPVGMTSAGANPHLQSLANQGRNGDTELALITPQTRDVLDALVGHPTKNPHTGFPEYFELGDVWDGVKSAAGSIYDNVVKPGWNNVVKPVLGGIAPAAGMALGTVLGGPGLGTALGGVGGSLVSSWLGGGNAEAGEGGSPLTKALTDGINGGFMGQEGWQQNLANSLGGSLNAAASGTPYAGLTNTAQNIGSNMMKGQGFGQAAQGALQNAIPSAMTSTQRPSMGMSGIEMQPMQSTVNKPANQSGYQIQPQSLSYYG